MVYDIAIIGGGPAGLSAGIYARRAGKSVVLFEGKKLGGLLNDIRRIENYPGFLGNGEELAAKMCEQLLAPVWSWGNRNKQKIGGRSDEIYTILFGSRTGIQHPD